MVERWADRNGRATFSPAELRAAFAGPHCLHDVISASKFRREEDLRISGRGGRGARHSAALSGRR